MRGTRRSPPEVPPWIEHEGERYLLGPVDPEENARRKKSGPRPNRTHKDLDAPFDLPGALLELELMTRVLSEQQAPLED